MLNGVYKLWISYRGYINVLTTLKVVQFFFNGAESTLQFVQAIFTCLVALVKLVAEYNFCTPYF
jgi:hypothetical protein